MKNKRRTYRKSVKNVLALMLCLVMLLGNFTAFAEVSETPEALDLWTEGSAAKRELIAYMEAITDESSADYIPVGNRVAVFDLDGTLFCETDPNYFDYTLLKYRVLEDPDYKDQASDFEREVALKIQEQNETGASFAGLEVDHGKAVASAFSGMTLDEFNAYIQEFKKQPMPSYEGMNRGDGWYRPMLQVVEFLQANDFTVYIVSGTDRFIVRGIVDNSPLNVPAWQIIGSDETLVAPDQGDTDGLSYVFDDNDSLVLGGEFIIKNLKMNKVTVIAQEIGVQPVLSFGNSTGDASMAEYVTNGNPYPSLAFMLCCDDTRRENGSESKADKMYALCDEFGWVPVSMKNDWTTIYGEGVRYLGADLDPAETVVACGIASINDFGNVVLNADPAEMDAKGYEPGDVISVSIKGETWQMPYGTQYSDVDPGYMVMRRKSDGLVLAVNQGSFAEAAGLSGESAELSVTIQLAEKAGYLQQYKARNMIYSDDRADYASDEAYANFRSVVMGEIPAGVLYRSATGINEKHGRPPFVNALYAKNGIRTVVNVANTKEEIEAMAGETESYYLTLYRDSHVVANGGLGGDLSADSFKERLAQDLREMMRLEAPYAVHCDEGKDRAGAVCAILEALMGASYDEMLQDYMLSYQNYYNLSETDEAYQAVLEGNAAYIFMTLSGTEHVSDMEQANYQQAAEQYLLSTGLSEQEIAELKLCLSGK